MIVQSDGHIHPQTGGMSVVPDDPSYLPDHRKPKWLGGTSKRPLWVIADDELPPALCYRPDDPDANGLVVHGFVEPTSRMLPDDLQQHLSTTRETWQEVRP